jgi:hypothetical protein
MGGISSTILLLYPAYRNGMGWAPNLDRKNIKSLKRRVRTAIKYLDLI